MQYIVRYQLKPMQGNAYQEWLLKNESAMKESESEGWTYLGTWFTVRGFGRYDCEARWELDDYDALGAEQTEANLRLMLESLEFIDLARDMETCLMKSTADVRIAEGV
jgi:hypothetical protein